MAIESVMRFKKAGPMTISWEPSSGALFYKVSIIGTTMKDVVHAYPDLSDTLIDLKGVPLQEGALYVISVIASDGTEDSTEGRYLFSIDKGAVRLGIPPIPEPPTLRPPVPAPKPPAPPVPPVPPKPPVPAPKPPAPTPTEDKPKVPIAPDATSLVQNLLNRISALQGQVGQLATIEQINTLTKSFDDSMKNLTGQLAGKADKEEIGRLDNAMQKLNETVEKRVREIEEKQNRPVPSSTTPPTLPPTRRDTPEAENGPEKPGWFRELLIKQDNTAVILAFILGLVVLVGIILGMYYYAMRSQDIGAAKGESLSSQISAREAQTAMIKSFDEINKLKDQVEGLERQRLTVPPTATTGPTVTNITNIIVTNPPPVTITNPPPRISRYHGRPIFVEPPPPVIYVVPEVVHQYETFFWSPTPMGNWYGYLQQHGFRYP